jgi:hypothetical protein
MNKPNDNLSFSMVGTPRCGVQTAQRAVPTSKLIHCQSNVLVDRIKIGLAIGLLTALTGCVGFVGGGYGGEVVVPGPDVFLFGGGYDRGRDVHDYSRRGGESRAVAHPSGGGHPSGGRHGEKR